MLGFGYAAISGIFLTLGFAPFSQAWVGWIALVPLAFYIVWKEISWKEAARLGYICGLIHFLSSLFWLINVSWLGWAILSIYLAVYPAIWAILWQRFVVLVPQELTSGFNLRKAVLGASAWVMLEWIRGWALTGFPWNFLGVTQSANVPLIQIADLGGIYLISWLVAFANCIFALHLRRLLNEIRGQQALRPRLDLIAIILIMVSAFMYGVHRLAHPIPPQAQLKYLAIQPNIPQDPWKQAPVDETLAKLRELTLEGFQGLDKDNLPNLIIWPETPISASVFEDENFASIVQEILDQKSYAILLGSNDYMPPKIYNAAVLTQKDKVQVYHKRHLVLMGEYVPYANIFPFLKRFVPPGVDFSAGYEANNMEMQSPTVKMAPFICFEDIIPRLAFDSMRENPDFFVNLTNDGWFRESSAARQHMNNALFRTIEFRRPMLRVTNNGITTVISENGVPVKIFSDVKTGDIHAAGLMRGLLLVPENTETIYQRWGIWTPQISVAIVLLGLIFARKRKNQ